MITFGLTGGIACGKSTACKTFISNGIPMVDADIVSRQVVEPGLPTWQKLQDHFGPDYFLQDGKLNRIKVGELVFRDPIQLQHLNRMVGPAIVKESARQLQELHNQGHLLVGYDAALICEMGNADKFRPLIVVSCPADMQLARLMSRNNLTREQAVARIGHQMPTEQKIAMADYVIDTSGSIESSINQTINIIAELRKL